MDPQKTRISSLSYFEINIYFTISFQKVKREMDFGHF